MQKIPIFLAKAGMKLAAEVKDDQGRTLCGPGVELDQSLIERFEKMGVKFLVVEGRPVKFPWDRSLQEDLELLEKRFAKVASDKRLEMIKETIRTFWQKSRGEA